jgi:excisionase family DNA binding protein
MPNLLTPQQVADALGITPRRVLQLINNGTIKATRIGPDSRGGVWIIDENEVKKASERKTTPGREPKT